MDGFTPTERRILAVLADHAGHAPGELRLCLADDLGPASNVRPHILRLRAKLRGRGLNIVTELHPQIRYRLEPVAMSVTL